MVFCSKNSKQMVFHTDSCRYRKNKNSSAWFTFSSVQKAKEAGYHSCSCCSRLARQMRKERRDIAERCRMRGIICRWSCGMIQIVTGRSQWYLVEGGKDFHMFLYHKNMDRSRQVDMRSPIAGYHFQKGARSGSITGFLDYITEHDRYRADHPEQLNIRMKDGREPLPGTRRYRRSQRRQKKFQDHMAAERVIYLLECQEILERAQNG